ncbi:centrosomal protein of 70 kDa isoform X2 [Nelusetta ayraudi]|uniref:centrosomal protein of 70 kDa isoform X2 n=1 Tax=Nelusetta ayraudi TaxID=303726 RepID=UPI003F7102D9
MELQEQMEWDDVNKLLRHHGFKPLHFANPVQNKNLPDLVLLDKKSAVEMRTTLRTMLADSERRQALIQELIKSNNQLKEEAEEQTRRAVHHSERSAELEVLLDGVKTRVQELEDRCLGKAARQYGCTQQLQQEKQEALSRCRVLEETLSKQRESAARLQKKLHFAVKEEERRLARQSRAFQDVCNRACQQNSLGDQQALDVIDFYEAKMSQLLDEIRSGKRHPERSQASHQSKAKKTGRGTMASFKSVLMAYQDQQKDCRGQLEELKTEVDNLKQTLEKRSPRDDILPQISGEPTAESGLCARYQQLLGDISIVATNPAVPFGLRRRKPLPVGWQETDFQTLPPTLELWAQQLCLLKDLKKGLNKLSSRLMPWQPPHEDGGAAKVEDMMLLVDSMLENTETDDGKVLRSPTRHTLNSMVSHFQTLFDVKSLQGVYPRMNELYTRLGEVTNAMRNLRDVLELDSRVPPAEVVNHVAKLVSSTQQSTELPSLLGAADLDSIIIKVKQHEEFFPAFHTLILDILQILGVSGLDDVLPALRSLKQIP